ncbi:MAG: sulfate adenylyltransferase subunit 2 [Bdellovibrionales bacterium]|nr:sulfate adenylyltransferase subunit 2 [Bdellovibrionales bacterium]
MQDYQLSYLQELEAESLFILREVASTFKNPVLLYSVGKDSSVLLHLCKKAFYPDPIPFPLLHVDTGYKFQEMYEFRDRLQREGFNIQVFHSPSALNSKASPDQLGTEKCCGILKTQALLAALKSGEYDAAIGGARRDEEKSRAKERVYSFRDVYGQWDPKNQKPELWQHYNGHLLKGESIRAFPLSNWTELDVWTYIEQEGIPVVPLYFAQKRKVLRKGSLLIPEEGLLQEEQKAQTEEVLCRYRTLGCSPCTGAIASNAQTVKEIIDELFLEQKSERSTRVIDHDRQGSMEIKKREGYF